jgi:hypothetical protein
MQKYAEAARFGNITQISRPEYECAVTGASKNLDPAFVVVLLFNDAITGMTLALFSFEKRVELLRQSWRN